MKKLFLFVFVAVFILGFASAQDLQGFESPENLPSERFHGLEKQMQHVDLFFTFDTEERIEKKLRYNEFLLYESDYYFREVEDVNNAVRSSERYIRRMSDLRNKAEETGNTEVFIQGLRDDYHKFNIENVVETEPRFQSKLFVEESLLELTERNTSEHVKFRLRVAGTRLNESLTYLHMEEDAKALEKVVASRNLTERVVEDYELENIDRDWQGILQYHRAELRGLRKLRNDVFESEVNTSISYIDEVLEEK